MSYRGSFTKCINAMGQLFGQERYEMLHMICNPKGKYYTVYTPKELEDKFKVLRSLEDENTKGHVLTSQDFKMLDESYGDRIVMSITNKELRIMYAQGPQDMFATVDTDKSYGNQN